VPNILHPDVQLEPGASVVAFAAFVPADKSLRVVVKLENQGLDLFWIDSEQGWRTSADYPLSCNETIEVEAEAGAFYPSAKLTLTLDYANVATIEIYEDGAM
jgi:hypothetical protein